MPFAFCLNDGTHLCVKEHFMFGAAGFYSVMLLLWVGFFIGVGGFGNDPPFTIYDNCIDALFTAFFWKLLGFFSCIV